LPAGSLLIILYRYYRVEPKLNSFPNYMLKIGGMDVHFMALFSEKADAVPLLLMHGWPGTWLTPFSKTSIANFFRFDPRIRASAFTLQDAIHPSRPPIPYHRSRPPGVCLLLSSTIRPELHNARSRRHAEQSDARTRLWGNWLCRSRWGHWKSARQASRCEARCVQGCSL
jgi:hypothetical protein